MAGRGAQNRRLILEILLTIAQDFCSISSNAAQKISALSVLNESDCGVLTLVEV